MNPPRTLARQAAGVLAAATIGLAVLSGCGSDGADTRCGLDSCTVTFDRGVEASASVLGIEAKLIGAQDDVVTIEVAGERLSLTAGQAATQVGGLQVTLDSLTDTQAVVTISR